VPLYHWKIDIGIRFSYENPKGKTDHRKFRRKTIIFPHARADVFPTFFLGKPHLPVHCDCPQGRTTGQSRATAQHNNTGFRAHVSHWLNYHHETTCNGPDMYCSCHSNSCVHGFIASTLVNCCERHQLSPEFADARSWSMKVIYKVQQLPTRVLKTRSHLPRDI